MAPPEIETHDDMVVLRPCGDVDIESADSLRETVMARVVNDSIGLIVDLSRTGYVDSAGIRVLFAVANRLEEHRQRLALVVPEEALIRHSLSVVDMESRASIHTTLEAALAHLRD